MGPRLIPPPGTPAAELARLSDEEHDLAERENDMLAHGVEVELRAREVQSQLDAARAALQRLAHTSARGDAEKAFLESLSLVVPPHVASHETSLALEQRRKALIARLQAIESESAAVRARNRRLVEISEVIARLHDLASQLAARAEAERNAPILLQPKPAPAPAAPAPKPAGPVFSNPPAAWSRGPTEEDRRRDAAAVAETFQRLTPIPAKPKPVPAPAPAPAAAAPPEPEAAPAPPATPAPARAPGGTYKEARSSPRMRMHTEVTLGSESNFYTGFSGDLSEGGVFVATYEKLLPPGTPVEISIALPNRASVQVPGKVRWVRDAHERTPGVFPGMGIQFDALSEEVSAAIRSFLQCREPMFWDE